MLLSSSAVCVFVYLIFFLCASSGKLKLRCGSQFTSKMEGMMNDLAIGGDHEAAFGKHLKEGQDSGSIDVDKIEFNVQVHCMIEV